MRNDHISVDNVSGDVDDDMYDPIICKKITDTNEEEGNTVHLIEVNAITSIDESISPYKNDTQQSKQNTCGLPISLLQRKFDSKIDDCISSKRTFLLRASILASISSSTSILYLQTGFRLPEIIKNALDSKDKQSSSSSTSISNISDSVQEEEPLLFKSSNIKCHTSDKLQSVTDDCNNYNTTSSISTSTSTSSTCSSSNLSSPTSTSSMQEETVFFVFVESSVDKNIPQKLFFIRLILDLFG
eukprot:gene11276-23589_t